MSEERGRGRQVRDIGGGETSKKARTRKVSKRDEVIRLEDLAPRRDVKGGAEKLLFGERLETPDD
jgi:hypothetical protein